MRPGVGLEHRKFDRRMGMWNYRAVRYKDGNGFGLHEVYYTADGKPWCMSQEPRGFYGETVDELIEALEMALKDAKSCGVFVEPEEWADIAQAKGEKP